MDIEKYKKKLNLALKLSGITIRSEFITLIIDCLNKANINLESTFEDHVRIISENLEKHVEATRSIEKKHIERAIEACIKSGVDDFETKFSVIDAFNFPEFRYDLTRKLYFLKNESKPKFLSKAETKNELFQNRYRNVLQRTKRNLMEKNMLLEENKITLHTVDFLLTVSHRTLQNKLILGSLFQKFYGKYFIEDPTGMVELDLTHAKYHGGFFYENCFVLVNGVYSDRILQVSSMILPPAEEFEKSVLSFPSLNYFGGKSESLLRESKKLQKIMNDNEGAMMVFISDLWLDKNIIFEKLEVLFEGLSEMPPIAFVFLGNYLCQCYGSQSFDVLTKSFKKLGELIYKFKNLIKFSHFVFVPGTSDPCMQCILPRIPLPKTITNEFTKLVPNSTFTTNPCRIQYCTREIVVSRSDILSKFMQETLNKPSKEKIGDFVTKTLTSQGHLSPFALNIQPVHWSFDHTLHLYPLPNLIVIGDKCTAYSGKYKGCNVVNPGSFLDSGFSFKTYIPASDEVDDCGL